MHCDRSNVSRLVDRAAARGLLVRHGEQHDGRVSMIALTPEGEQLATRFIARLESLTEPLLATWSKRRQLDTAATLGTLASTLESAISEELPASALSMTASVGGTMALAERLR